MTRKNLWMAVVVLVGLLAWWRAGRTPSEAEDSQHPENSGATMQAAVVRVERRQLGNE